MSSPGPVARVGGNVALAAVASAFVRLSGLAQQVVFAGVFGAGLATDAYNAAFRAANFFRELLAEGSLANIYVPVFAETTERDGLNAAWKLANAFLGILLVVLGALSLLTFVFAEGWVWLIAAGYAAEPGKFELAVLLTRVLSPFLVTLSLASLFMAMLNVRGRFFLPAIAPAAFNVVVIAGILLARPFEAWTGQPAILLVAVASLLGGSVQFLVQVPALRRDGFHIRPTLRGHPALRRLLRFLVPAFIGIMTVQFNLAVETQFASRFGDGPVSYLLYAFRLVSLPTSIVASSVATVALAEMANLIARDRRQDAREALREAISLNAFATIPAAVALYLLAEPLVRLMFERGAFLPPDTSATAAVARMYAIALWGICFQRVALPCYYALGRPYFPMVIALITMLAKIPLAWFLVYRLDLSYVGLPISHAILVTIECVALWWGFGRFLGGLGARLYVDHLRVLAATALMGLVLRALSPYARGAGLLWVGGVGMVVYLAASHGLGLDGPRRIMERLRLARPPARLPPNGPLD
jgi:putative peptidoglycan lipid II flippase